jgi:hypothetical protein
MNKYLTIKNEELIKHNATDFYIMSIYSMDLLSKDKLRLNEFRNYKKNTKVKLNPAIFMTNIGICALLVYKFKSLLIVPVFYLSYFCLDRLISKNTSCFFCERGLVKKQKLQQYEDYYNLINHVFKRNSRIRDINDFENELDRYIKELKL